MEAVKAGDENNSNSLKPILIVWIYIKTFVSQKAS